MSKNKPWVNGKQVVIMYMYTLWVRRLPKNLSKNSDSSDDDIKYEIDRQGELEVFQPFPVNFKDFMHQDDYR